MDKLVEQIMQEMRVMYRADELEIVGLRLFDDFKRFMLDHRADTREWHTIFEEYIIHQLQSIEIEQILNIKED